jgi:hypothetical protein
MSWPGDEGLRSWSVVPINVLGSNPIHIEHTSEVSFVLVNL